MCVQMAMGGALLGIGKRNRQLNKAAIIVAKAIGPLDYGPDNNCDPFDVESHLKSDYIRKKFAKQTG